MQTAIHNAHEVPILCSVCGRVQTCERSHREGLLVWYCEHCDSATDSLPFADTLHASPAMAGAEAAERLLGLCVNCERRDYCAQARQAGGVWHCEEYL